MAAVLEPIVSETTLAEEERFGKWDARTGLPLTNHYSSGIFGARLKAYLSAFRKERLKGENMQ